MRCVLIVILALTVALFTHAEGRTTIRTSFTYDEDAVQSRLGAERVRSQLLVRAREVCRIEISDRHLVSRELDAACVDEFLSDAVLKIGSPILADLINPILRSTREGKAKAQAPLRRPQ